MEQQPVENRLPLVLPLDAAGDPVDWFQALEGLPGRLWLDSAGGAERGVNASVGATVKQLSRYSFLTADPVDQLIAHPTAPDPWPQLQRWVRRLPPRRVADLPPFQGGIAGLIGYEAGHWLEPLEFNECCRGQVDDLPTPAISLGLYDWTIAIDHHIGRRWLICQGLTAEDRSAASDAISQRKRAQARARDVLKRLGASRLSGAPRGRAGKLDRQAKPPTKPQQLTDASQPASCRVISNFSGGQFREAVASIVQRICAGDSFQVNLAQRLIAEQTIGSDALYLRLRQVNSAPFAGFYDGGTFQVLSSSPEGFLQVRDRHVITRPIKGTVPRRGHVETDRRLAAELAASEKDRAENIMIVDLMRNDLSRVCTDRSVTVTQLCEVEPYRFVQHLVSAVEGDLRPDADVVDLLRACFPGGSVTGAPKIEAIKTIARLEGHPRGPYCGSLGYISCSGDADFNILIRTITATAGKLQIPVGGGITARSDPAAEEAETWAKAEGMLQALPAGPKAERPRNLRPAPVPCRADL